jgi:hypothetical protein
MNGYQYYLHQAHSDKQLVVNCRGKTIVPDTFTSVSQFQTPDLWGYHVATKNEKEGLLDTNGRWLTPPLYDHIDDSFLYDAFHYVRKDEQWGLLNARGKLTIPCKYHEIKEAREPEKESEYPYNWSPFNGSEQRDFLPLFIVSVGNYSAVKYGLLDEQGKELLPCEYDSLSYVYIDSNTGWYPYSFLAQDPLLKRKRKIKSKTDRIPEIKIQRVICAKKGNYWGLLTINNEVLAPFEYDWLGKDAYPGFVFRKNGKSGRMDFTGKQLKENE